MKKSIIILLFAILGQKEMFAQEYFPQGTKWTEIRLDTLKFNNWYSRVGENWMPNYEIIEYYVKGEYIKKNWDEPNTFRCVYSNGPDWRDSLTFMVYEGIGSTVEATVPVFYNNELMVYPGMAYQFSWDIGTKLFCQTIYRANCTYISSEDMHEFGTIDEIKEGIFGGIRPLKYVELNGVRIIQGIGVTAWDDGECVFGPVDLYTASFLFQLETQQEFVARNYRSMLVHFERNGEVLYDVWPSPEGMTNEVKYVLAPKPENDTPILFDLSGRRLEQKPQKGIYIQDGKKYIK